MNREWMRGPQWASVEARTRWAPVLARGAAAWAELELLSVSAGIRPSALVYLDAGDIAKATADADRVGLEVTPLTFDVGTGIRAAVHGPGLRRDWIAAWGAVDDGTIGRLLGFPACCAEHFARYWVEQRRTDTVLTQRTVNGPVEANVLLRQLGVRLVPHLPCSADCAASVDLGRRIAGAGEAAGVDVAALRALLALPVEYSALHGTAQVSTDPFRFFAGTDYTEAEVVVRREGTVSAPPTGTTVWEDNGFTSAEGMAYAHQVVAAVAEREPVTSALDLGCGDGTLLAYLAHGREGHWWGIEVDEGRASRGRARYPGVDLLTMDLGDVHSALFPQPFDVVLLMPGRLRELEPIAADRLRAALRVWARRVVVYNYDGHDLGRLCADAGLPAPKAETLLKNGAASAADLGGF